MTDTTAWYIKWAAEHCDAFGFREQDQKTVVAWRPVFERLYTFSELQAATHMLIAADNVPPFANQHRSLIMGLIGAAREKARRKDHEERTGRVEREGCDLCVPADWPILYAVALGIGGTPGLIYVPHPGYYDGQIRRHLLTPDKDATGIRDWVGLPCLCPAGQKIENNHRKADRRFVSFAEYEQRFGNWREVSAARVRILTAPLDNRACNPQAELEQLAAAIDRRRRELAAGFSVPR